MFGNSAGQTPGILVGMKTSMPAAALLLQAARHAAQNVKLMKEKNKEGAKVRRYISSSSSKENRPCSNHLKPKVVKRKKPAKVITVYSSPVEDVRRRLKVPAELPKYVKDLMKTDENIRRLVHDKSMTIATIVESTKASSMRETGSEAVNDETTTPKLKRPEARLIATPRTNPRTPVEETWKHQSSTPSRVLQDRRDSGNVDLSSFLEVSFGEQEKSQAGTSASYLSNLDSMLLTSKSDLRSYSSSSFEDSSDVEVSSID